MYIDFLSEIGKQQDVRRNLTIETDCKQTSTSEPDFWMCIKDYILMVEVEQASGYENQRDTSFNWKVTEYTGYDLILQLEFNEAVYVSSNAIPDVLKITFIT